MNNSRKRKLSDNNLDDSTKRLCLESTTTNNLPNESSQSLSDKFNNHEIHNYRENSFEHLIKLMYQLDLSVLFLVRKFIHKRKYPFLKISFNISEINKFNDIVFHDKEKYTCIQIENINNRYIENGINFSELFSKGKISFFVNKYFNNFVKHIISKPHSLLNKVDYLIIYTNTGLDLTENCKLKKMVNRNFYPFQFVSIDVEKNGIIKDFLLTDKDQKMNNFFQFSQDETTIQELLKRLEFSPTVQKIMKEMKYSQEFEKKIKLKFLDKLLFAVKQPDRAELKSIIKKEINKVQHNYMELQERILRNLFSQRLGSKVIYEFNVLISILHDIFLYEKVSFTNLENYYKSNIITISYKEKITFIKVYDASKIINFNQLFPLTNEKGKNEISLNNYFSFFIEELKKGKDIKFIVIYTNVNFDLTKDYEFKKQESENFYPLKLNRLNINKKRYKILKYCSCINNNYLYQFAQEELIKKKLMELLQPQCFLQTSKDGIYSDEKIKELKEIFLHKLIFAINQFENEKLNNLIIDCIEKNNISVKTNKYNYEELHEIALRWLEDYRLGPITKEIMKKLYKDIKHDRLSLNKIQNQDFTEEFRFAKGVVGEPCKCSDFNYFLEFLIEGKGKEYLKVMKRNALKLTSVSSLIHQSKSKSVQAFEELYKILFDDKGNPTYYLKTLKDNKIRFSILSGSINSAHHFGPEIFKDIFHLWFDDKGNKTKMLEILNENNINLLTFSGILSCTGTNAAKAFKNLFYLLFEENGKKTLRLRTLEKNKISLNNISSMIAGSRKLLNGSVKAFIDLFNLWIDENGNKRHYLKVLENNKIKITTVTSILSGSGIHAVTAFKDLYNLWFDETGNKTEYIKSFEKNKIKLTTISNILNSSRYMGAKAFKELHDMWFDYDGNKKPCLKLLEEKNINLNVILLLLAKGGSRAPKRFMNLINSWFDKDGNKTPLLLRLEENGFNSANMSSLLRGSRSKAENAFKSLYDI